MTVCENHSGLHAEIAHLNKETVDIWGAVGGIREDIKQIVNRPPPWCTAVIALLSGLLGSAITVAIFALNRGS